MAKRRTAKQKAATKKLVAMNKRRARKTTTRRRRTTRKGMLTLKRQKAYQPKRRKPTMARRRRTSKTRSVTRGISNVFNRGTLGKVAVGVGAATIVGTIMDRFIPASPITAIAKPVAAYSAGGAAGAIGSVLLEGGLGSITQFFGMQSQSTNQAAGGGFSV
jgi:hypothetical protein